MIVKCTLVVNSISGVRVVKRHPRQVGWDEIAIPLTLDIPDGWFRRSVPIVEIDVPEPQLGHVQVETGEVQP